MGDKSAKPRGIFIVCKLAHCELSDGCINETNSVCPTGFFHLYDEKLEEDKYVNLIVII